MSTTDRVHAILGATIDVYRRGPGPGLGAADRAAVLADLDAVAARLHQPLRVALAGTLKAGKSTLVNALVGEQIAPTDATEATRVVTWFRHGRTPRVTARHRDGRRIDVPIRRGAADSTGLDFDLSGVDLDSVGDLDVAWPAAELVDTTLVDTPGTSSLSRDVSRRTLDLLVPDDRVPRVDAVVFLLRTLGAEDVALLTRIGQLVGGSSGALGVVGVASRADEIGAGRIDAMLSARDVAARFTAEMDRTGVCQAVVPVSGLLALTARTLRHGEFVALQKLAEADPAVLARAMLSVDRFVRDDAELPVDAVTRARLLERFGVFGVRLAVLVLRTGVTDSVALADELLERSGLTELRRTLDVHVAQRSDLLKAHTALRSLRRLVTAHPVAATPQIVADLDPLLADTHAFEELRLLTALRAQETTLGEDELASLRRILGASGTGAAQRLGLSADGDGPRAAHAAAGRWRRRAEHPLNDPFTVRACRGAVRSADALVAGYAGGYRGR